MKNHPLFRFIEALLILSLLAVFYLKDISSVPFHIDESHWIGTSYMFEAYFKGEFWSDAWRENQHTVTNPPVPRYVIGLSRFLAGYRIPDLNRAWEYSRNVNYNVRMGAMPSDALLWWSRLPMAILAIISIWLGFFFIKKIVGRIPAYIWILLSCLSSYFLLQLRRAMAESSILFLVMLGAFLCYQAIKTIDDEAGGVRRKAVFYLILSGVCLGLAGEAKINGLSVLAGIILSLLLVFWKKRETLGSKIRKVVSLSALVTVVAGITFVASYPYLWPDPFGRTIHVLQNRIDEMKYQSVQHAPDALNTISQKLTVIPMRIFNDYSIVSFNGAIVLNVLLTLLGLVFVLIKLKAWLKGDAEGAALLTLLCVALTAALPSFLTLLDWDRYYLFPIFFSSMLIAIGIGWLLQKLYQVIRHQKPAAQGL